MKSNLPLVSIITVCFNSEKTIEDTIQSVLSQSYSNIEYLVLDGESNDSTLKVIEKYKDNIAQISSEKDKGMYDALNKGIAKANGDIIGIINADDFYIDDKVIEKVARLMEEDKSDALYADLYYVAEDDTNQIKRHWKSGKYKNGNFLKGWMPPHPTFFVRKELYGIYGGFNLNLKSAADYELMLRLIHKHQIKLSYLAEVIVRMRVGGMSNASLLNRLKANREDKKAWIINGLKPKPYTLLFKPLRKLGQFFY